MKTNPKAARCPKCQALVPPEAPQGLCPKCLLAGVAAVSETTNAPGTPFAPPALETIAAAFPQLEMVELIGQGGMGLVYKARQKKLERWVALKLLPHTLQADPAFEQRFQQEARVLAHLNHPNIVTVFDFGQADGFFYLLMEYVDGVNLRQAMQAGRFSPAEALAIVPKICEALQYAHNEGVLHRDIKPENILLDTRGRVKIADFGIAKFLGEMATHLTTSGAAIGTPHYMAPEQLEKPRDVDHRADLYSLGVVFYELLTGELPLGRFAPPSEKALVDPRVDPVVLRTLEKERERRFQNAEEIKTRVEELQTSPPIQPKAKPASPPPLAPRANVESHPLARQTRWSKRAVLGTYLTLSSWLFFFPLFKLCLSFFPPLRSAWPDLSSFTLAEALPPALVGAMLAIPGTQLGLSALKQIGHQPDAFHGKAFAMIAGLSWPLILLNSLIFASAWGFTISLAHPLRIRSTLLFSVPAAALLSLALDMLVISLIWSRLTASDKIPWFIRHWGRAGYSLRLLGITLGLLLVLWAAWKTWAPLKPPIAQSHASNASQPAIPAPNIQSALHIAEDTKAALPLEAAPSNTLVTVQKASPALPQTPALSTNSPSQEPQPELISSNQTALANSSQQPSPAAASQEVKVSIPANEGDTTLIGAAMNQRNAAVQALLKQGTSPDTRDAQGHTALMYAAATGSLKIMELLLEAGASLNQKSLDGTTALMAAAWNGQSAAVQLLVERGATLGERDQESQTALMKAAFRGHLETVRVLLERGADPNAVNAKGQHALMLAAGAGFVPVLELLCQHKAHLNHQDEADLSAVAWAVGEGHYPAAEFLVRQGAIAPAILWVARAFKAALGGTPDKALEHLEKAFQANDTTPGPWKFMHGQWLYELPKPSIALPALLVQSAKNAGNQAKAQEYLQVCHQRWSQSHALLPVYERFLIPAPDQLLRVSAVFSLSLESLQSFVKNKQQPLLVQREQIETLPGSVQSGVTPWKG